MTLAEIRAEAKKVQYATNYDAAARTPAKRLAALIVALVDHLEQAPTQTIGTIASALETVNDED